MLETSDARSALDEIFDGAELCVTKELSPCFKCDCSRERLEKVLIALGRDELMDMIKADIAKVISKYMKIDAKSMEIQISKTGIKGNESKVPTLYANIPILDLHSK